MICASVSLSRRRSWSRRRGVGLLHFDHGAAERTELLFEARTIDRDFAGVVDEAIEQVGADAHLFLRGTHADILVVAGDQHVDRRRQRLELDLRRGGRMHRRGNCRVIAFAARARVEFRDQRIRHRDRAARADAGDHRVQAVEAAFQQRDAVAAEFGALFDHRFQQRLHDMAEFAHGHDAGHARAALDRVQVALQADQWLALARRVAQLREQAVGVVEQVAAFLDEDVDQFRVELGQVQRFVRIVGRSLGFCEQFGDGGLDRFRFRRGRARFGRLLHRRFDRRHRGVLASQALDGVFGFQAGVFGGFLGFDAFGFSAFGFEAFGFEAFGFEAFGFEAFGFDAFGFDAFGFDAFGFEAFGFEAFGFEAFGFEAFGFEAFGFEAFGFEAFGFEAFGFEAFGFEAFGFEAFGFEAFGFETFGFEAFGFEAFGFEAFGFEAFGFEAFGFGLLAGDAIGLGVFGLQSRVFLGLRLFGSEARGFVLREVDLCFLGGLPRTRFRQTRRTHPAG